MSWRSNVDNHERIARSAIVLAPSKVCALVEAAPKYMSRLSEVVDAVQRTNSTLLFDKRIQKHNIVIVDKLPVTQKATLFRKEIILILKETSEIWPSSRTLYSGATESGHESPVPTVSNHILSCIEETLSSVLGARTEDVQRASGSLSDLAINSLAVVRLSSAVQKAFRCSIKYSDFYNAHTVERLAALISARTTGTPAAPRGIAATAPLQAQLLNEGSNDDMVIFGAVCKFPGGINSLDDLRIALVAPPSLPARTGLCPARALRRLLFSVGTILKNQVSLVFVSRPSIRTDTPWDSRCPS